MQFSTLAVSLLAILPSVFAAPAVGSLGGQCTAGPSTFHVPRPCPFHVTMRIRPRRRCYRSQPSASRGPRAPTTGGPSPLASSSLGPSRTGPSTPRPACKFERKSGDRLRCCCPQADAVTPARSIDPSYGAQRQVTCNYVSPFPAFVQLSSRADGGTTISTRTSACSTDPSRPTRPSDALLRCPSAEWEDCGEYLSLLFALQSIRERHDASDCGQSRDRGRRLTARAAVFHVA